MYNDSVRTTATSKAEGRLVDSVVGKKRRSKNRQLVKIVKDGMGGCCKKKY